MLIRHYALPKSSPLLVLAEPAVADNLDQPPETPSYLARTLQPQLPIENALVPPLPQKKQQPLSPCIRPKKRKQPMALAQEEPHSLNTIQPPSFPQIQPEEEQLVPFSKQRMTTFARATPPRRNRNPLCIPTLSNNAYLTVQPTQEQQQDAIQRPLYLQNHRSELYRTIEKHKFNNQIQEHNRTIDTPFAQHKKYTLSLPKQHLTTRHEHEQEPLQPPQPQPARTSPRRLSAKRPKGLSQPALINKHKLPPNDPEQAGLLLPSHRQKRTTERSVKKTTQEEQRLTHRDRSQEQISKTHKRSTSVGLQSKIEVSYRTPLGRLRQICSMNDLQSDKLLLRVPQVFAYPFFNENDSEQELFSKGRDLLTRLGVAGPNSQLSIRRYSNCVVLTRGELGIVWHFSGRVYLGGWKQSNVGTGCKQGLGLEWSPNKYYYYGQFNRNKREGIGLMKSNNNDILAGHWRHNKLMAGCRGQESPIAWLKE